MSGRELVVLGTGSQVPTRTRNHNGYLLRWDETGILFDPGEGIQRQFVLAGISVCTVDAVCITHFHGDHCLGLPGVLQRLSLERCRSEVPVFFPASGREYFDRLQSASIFYSELRIEPRPIEGADEEYVELFDTGRFRLRARRLDHTAPCWGYRLEEPPGRRFLPEKLAAAGLSGPAVGDLKRRGSIEAGGRTIRMEDVSTERPGSVFAFIMDTRPCANAVALARNADLLVMEATYAEEHRELAYEYGHSTAREAAETARKAGARRLALSHFSQRYPDAERHVAEARAVFAETVALNDLDRVAIPRPYRR